MTRTLVLAFVLGIAVWAVGVAGVMGALSVPIVPRCEEDAVLIGVGDFDNGRWSAHECGPAVDDYIGGKDQ